MKFNINDKVRVVADEAKLAAEGLEDLELIGQEGVIHSIEIHGEGIDIAVEIGKDIWSFDEEDLELVDTAGGFKVGDRVKVTAGGFKNNEGIIVSGKSQEIKNVKIGRGNFSIRKEDLELVKGEVKVVVIQDGEIRTFDTGATRDTDIGKWDYEGFLSPLVLKRFAEYMHKCRIQSDGKLRESDNWQKGIPVKQYMKSKWRHFMDTWCFYRRSMDFYEVADYGELLEESLCAELFNSMGFLHEVLKNKTKVDREGPFPGGA